MLFRTVVQCSVLVEGSEACVLVRSIMLCHECCKIRTVDRHAIGASGNDTVLKVEALRACMGV